jgi:hypothetical protein
MRLPPVTIDNTALKRMLRRQCRSRRR